MLFFVLILDDMDFSLLNGAVAVVMVHGLLFLSLFLLLDIVAWGVRPFVGAVVVSVRVSLRCWGGGGSLLHWLLCLRLLRLLRLGMGGHEHRLLLVARSVGVRLIEVVVGGVFWLHGAARGS